MEDEKNHSPIPRDKSRGRFYFFIAVGTAMLAGILIIVHGAFVSATIQQLGQRQIQATILPEFKKPAPIVAKGIYLTASSAANPTKRWQMIELIQSTELNAVVIDIKDYTGYVLYDSTLPLVNELHTEKNILKDVPAIIADFKKAGIYVIARQTVFQDPALAKAKPSWAITVAGGGLWHDYKGLSWVDPTRNEVWRYNMAIAREASFLGFDEINFDYVRFPSDGNIRTTVYAELKHTKAETMASFYQFIKHELRHIPSYTSLDLFGLVLEAKDFDLNIGQKLSSALGTVDYIYPMTYPSHYPPGHLKMSNPADFPYEVIANGLRKAEPTALGSITRIRPWLQAFNLGAVYDGDKIRAQIRAAEESPLTEGWMLWNASNNYSSKGLLAQEK